MVSKPGPAQFPDEIFRPALPPSRPLQALRESTLTIATFNEMTLTYDKAKTQHEGLLQPRKLHALQRQILGKGADWLGKGVCPKGPFLPPQNPHHGRGWLAFPFARCRNFGFCDMPLVVALPAWC